MASCSRSSAQWRSRSIVADWDLRAAQIDEIVLSTTSVVVVYAVMVETRLNDTDLGKLILAAGLVNDLRTVLGLGLLLRILACGCFYSWRPQRRFLAIASGNREVWSRKRTASIPRSWVEQIKNLLTMLGSAVNLRTRSQQSLAGIAGVGKLLSLDAAERSPAGLFARLRRTAERFVFGGNKYDRTEFAGAFGDLGTFIPFVVAYISVNNMDPLGILLSFGILKIFVGLYFKTPISVQPMKAIGGAAIAHPELVSSGMIWGSGIFSAVLWTAMALTGTMGWLEKITAKPVMRGIMLGLGISFIVEGMGMAEEEPMLAIVGMAVTFLLLTSKRVPAMLCLLALGIGYSLVQNEALLGQIAGVAPRFRLPEFVLGKLTWSDLLMGSMLLGLPQAPLTLSNAILAVTAENNELFPDRPIKVKAVALDHGFMNAVSAAMGGVPLCHGAGGMAGHVRFGARTGGALVMLGVLVAGTGLFFSDSVAVFFKLIPTAVLGVILFFAGLELASAVRDIGSKKGDVYVMLVTAGVGTINIGLGFLAGLVVYYGIRTGFVKVQN